ncbi:MAG TPA: hypothetical protein VMZ91_05040 [Candidatus Paceibacterota bacterium]|nr:hypothetical protein [Candidatus Paceibacterota bacterium]
MKIIKTKNYKESQSSEFGQEEPKRANDIDKNKDQTTKERTDENLKEKKEKIILDELGF